MTNIYFPDEEVTVNDLYFVCYMVERIARQLKQPNKYVVNTLGKRALQEKLSLANVLHCENPLKIEDEWIQEYKLQKGEFDRLKINSDFVRQIPTETQIGKVYMRLIVDTLQPDENYVEGMIRVYNDDICKKIDDYNCSAYYEPSYVIARAYNDGGF